LIDIGALDMAIANLFGRAIVAVDDIRSVKGPILSSVSPIHWASTMSTVIMTGIAIIGLLYRPQVCRVPAQLRRPRQPR